MWFAARYPHMSRREAGAERKGLDNYEGAYETGEARASENSIAKSVEEYTAATPSLAYLGIAAGAMALSLALHLGGRGGWGRFVLQCVPACLILGVYRKLRQLEDHDLDDRAGNRGYRS
jgi:hypothetical protein